MNLKSLIIPAFCFLVAHAQVMANPFSKESKPVDPLAPTAEEIEQAQQQRPPVSPSPKNPSENKPPAITPKTAPNAPVNGAAAVPPPDVGRTTVNTPSVSDPGVSSPVVPQNPASFGTNYNSAKFGELDAIRSQNALLQEKAKTVELQAKIKGNNGSDSQAARGTIPAPNLFPVGGQIAGQTPGAIVLSVEGIDEQRTATVILPSGQKVVAREGTSLPGIGVVKSISLNEVCLQSKAQARCLPFSPSSTSVR